MQCISMLCTINLNKTYINRNHEIVTDTIIKHRTVTVNYNGNLQNKNLQSSLADIEICGISNVKR